MRLATPMPSAPPEPPSPMTTEMMGTPERGHHLEVHRDRLGLTALLRADAGVGAGRVDEGEDRQPEAVGELDQAPRLPVPLGARHAEVADHVLLRAPALLVADHDDRLAVEPGEAADDRAVVREAPVALELEEVGEQPRHVVEGVRPARVTRELDDLPGGQVAEDLRLELLRLLLELADLVGEVDAAPPERSFSSSIFDSSSISGRSNSSAKGCLATGGL